MRTRSEARAAREREHEQRQKPRTPEYTIDTPSDVLNEQVLIAAEIADEDVRKRLTKLLPPDAFYAEEHKAIQAGLVELERRKLSYDPATIVRLAPDVDIRILEALSEARPDVPKNLDFHIETLQWDWKRARITQGPLAALIESIQNPKETPERVNTLLRQLGKVADEGTTGRSYIRDSKEVVRQAMSALRKRIQGDAFYPYGIDGLDYYEEGAVDTRGKNIGGTRRIRPGAAPGTISMVTSVSGSGKTSFTGHLALNQHLQKRKVLYGSWEEDAPVTIEFLAVLSLEWSRSKILDGRSNRLKDDSDDFEPLNHEELVMLEEEMHAISKNVHFFDNPFQRSNATTPTGRRITNNDHLDIIHEELEQSGAEVFIADLWERCLVETKPENERQALYRQLDISKQQQTHVVIVHQQRTKDIETRADKRPTREGIIGSGAWLDVCWLVMAPFLPAKWKNVPDNTMELYILKQKNGPWPLCVEFEWDPDKGQVRKGRSVPVARYAESSDEAFGAPKPTKRRGR